MEFLGKQIAIKSHGCNTMGTPGKAIIPSVNLFVKVTKQCNAHCQFCSNANASDIKTQFDINKFVDIVYQLKYAGINLNRINITGGEPSVVSVLVNDILDKVEQEHFGNIHLHLNTNGLLPQSQELMRHQRWDSISVSLHHYSCNCLSELYGCRINEQAFLFDGINLQKLNVSCNLIKGYIDNDKEAHKMLDFTLELGVPRIGFVALMKINDYCNHNFIDIEDIHWNEIPHLYFTKSMDRGDDCKCSNYLYNKCLHILEVYMRNYANYQYCESSLVFDGQFLRQGFYDDNIIY